MINVDRLGLFEVAMLEPLEAQIDVLPGFFELVIVLDEIASSTSTISLSTGTREARRRETSILRPHAQLYFTSRRILPEWLLNSGAYMHSIEA